VECRPGYRRVRLCVREDLYRALVIIEASEGLKRYRLIEDALLMYLEGKNRHALGGGFRVLTVSEELYNQLVSIGGGSAEAGLRRLSSLTRGMPRPRSHGNHSIVQTTREFVPKPHQMCL
jgi:hypothetical protein